IVAAVALSGGSYLKGRVDGREAAHTQHQRDLSQAVEASRHIEREARRRAEEVDREHQAALAALDDRYRAAADRIGSVRLCPPADRPPAPRDPSAASGSDAAPDGDRLPEPAGARDIGPGLVELARLADRQTQQLIACQ